jgi:hypothetical protein
VRRPPICYRKMACFAVWGLEVEPIIIIGEFLSPDLVTINPVLGVWRHEYSQVRCSKNEKCHLSSNHKIESTKTKQNKTENNYASTQMHY